MHAVDRSRNSQSTIAAARLRPLGRIATVGRRVVLGGPCPADRSEIARTSLLAGQDEQAYDRDHDDRTDDPKKNGGWHRTGPLASHKSA